MIALLLLCGLITLAAGQGGNSSAPACTECLHPIWYISVANYPNGTDPCSFFSLEEVFACLDDCDMAPIGQPLSLKIRQLTQISDIFSSLIANNCSLVSDGNFTDQCSPMIECTLSVSNYEYKGSTSHSPFLTVFDYQCGLPTREAALVCLNHSRGCVSLSRYEKLGAVLSEGIRTACDNPRRCVKYGNIFETKPGTKCGEFYQEPAAYGPSTGVASKSNVGEGFNPETCRTDYIGGFICPRDPTEVPVYSETQTTTAAITTTGTLNLNEFEEIIVNTSLPCEKCLYPLWYSAVTTSGRHLCRQKFQSQLFTCLANCRCCSHCVTCTERKEELNAEVFVKVADIFKALEESNCTGNAGCSAASYQCTDNLANFYPQSAPHTTVNTLSCLSVNLQATLDCYDATCNVTEAGLLAAVTRDGFSTVCSSKLRCMSFGSLFEYVRVSEVTPAPGEVAEPCANFKQAPVNDWQPSTNIKQTRPGLLLNMENCTPDWPANVVCPAEVSL